MFVTKFQQSQQHICPGISDIFCVSLSTLGAREQSQGGHRYNRSQYNFIFLIGGLLSVPHSKTTMPNGEVQDETRFLLSTITIVHCTCPCGANRVRGSGNRKFMHLETDSNFSPCLDDNTPCRFLLILFLISLHYRVGGLFNSIIYHSHYPHSTSNLLCFYQTFVHLHLL